MKFVVAFVCFLQVSKADPTECITQQVKLKKMVLLAQNSWSLTLAWKGTCSTSDAWSEGIHSSQSLKKKLACYSVKSELKVKFRAKRAEKAHFRRVSKMQIRTQTIFRKVTLYSFHLNCSISSTYLMRWWGSPWTGYTSVLSLFFFFGWKKLVFYSTNISCHLLFHP